MRNKRMRMRRRKRWLSQSIYGINANSRPAADQLQLLLQTVGLVKRQRSRMIDHESLAIAIAILQL